METVIREFLAHEQGWGLIFSKLAAIRADLVERAARAETADTHADCRGQLRGVEIVIQRFREMREKEKR